MEWLITKLRRAQKPLTVPRWVLSHECSESVPKLKSSYKAMTPISPGAPGTSLLPSKDVASHQQGLKRLRGGCTSHRREERTCPEFAPEGGSPRVVSDQVSVLGGVWEEYPHNPQAQENLQEFPEVCYWYCPTDREVYPTIPWMGKTPLLLSTYSLIHS